MSAKTTGVEFKKFYSDETYWKEGVYHDDELVEVNGEEWNEKFENIPDDAKVKISFGEVLETGDEDPPSFEMFFKRWKKIQSTAKMIIEFPIEKTEEIKEKLKEMGVKFYG